ncbi:MAG: ATP-binding protein, partial [Chitinivibrionales bacterium]|nr:ATP-binding protein [Chitinivibrionales bacterium]
QSFIVRVTILMMGAVLGGFISRNNLSAIQKIINSEARYQNLVHRLPEMLFMLDKRGVFLWANMTVYSLLGVPATVVVKRRLRDFLCEPDSLKLDKGITRGTYEIKDQNGDRKFVDLVLQPVTQRDADNRTETVWEGIMTDITDRELAISRREEMVARLFEYKKIESMSTLASGMAHDFNNILQTVSDISSMVAVKTAEEETKKRMTLISDTLLDAKFLISELMTLGKNRPVNYKSIHVQQFFDMVVPLFSDQIGANYQVALKLPAEPLYIKGDIDYLKRIVQNLFINARDAMPGNGKITLEGFIETKDELHKVVVLRFSDTGCGIPADITEKIFEPFFTTKKPGKGTGLGLALVRQIINLHGGQVFVENTSTRGTTFRIELPYLGPPAPNEEDTATIMKVRINSTILLLDDDAKIRDILKFFLREFKYTVCEASTLGEGATQLTAHRDDCRLLIMDWKLGEDDPIKVIKSLRAINPELIIIVISGYPAKKKSIEEMNIYQWITKPYDKNQLDFEIQRALHRIPK